MSTPRFKYKQLASFLKPHSLIPYSASGLLYKGRLRGNQIVAIRVLKSPGGSQQFVLQTLLLTILRHENLVKLLGYCIEGDRRFLVFEFMPLGSLADRLHDHQLEPLDWNTRMKIAAGTAKGLEFLHHQATPPVIHADLKPSSILLNKGFQPKLSRFGRAKLGPVGDKTFIRTSIVGVNGYMAPEYATRGELCLKSDVYSFGVILLELITGKRVINSSTSVEEESNLVVWARPHMQDAMLFPQLADPKLRGQFPPTALSQAIALITICLEENASARPSFADIVPSLDPLATET